MFEEKLKRESVSITPKLSVLKLFGINPVYIPPVIFYSSIEGGESVPRPQQVKSIHMVKAAEKVLR